MAALTHGCGVQLGAGQYDTYQTKQRSIVWEGSHSNPNDGGSATIYEYEGTCPACGGVLSPDDHSIKVVDG